MDDGIRNGRVRVAVASRNPVKLDAATGGFTRTFPDATIDVVPCDAPSGVGDQPWSDAETLQGARNRAEGARAEQPDARFWVGIEGGLADLGRSIEAFAWVVVISAAGSGRSRTASFELPPGVVELVRGGLELGEADDRVFGRSGSKQREGAVGLLTGGAIDRRGLYEPAVVLALVPLARPDLYGPDLCGPGQAMSLDADHHHDRDRDRQP